MKRFWYVTAGSAGAVGVSVLLVRVLKFGDVDPLSASFGLASLVVTIAALVVAVRSARDQPLDTAVLAGQLADKVTKKERLARQQLLGDRQRTIDLRFDFRPEEQDAEGASDEGDGVPDWRRARAGRLRKVANYYKMLQPPRRMLITGAPGAGKTVLAVELMMALLENRDPQDPVPVRLSASSWDLGADPSMQPRGAAQRMENWLVAHLVEVYEFSRRSAQALVNAGRVLPVVDGIDELDADDRRGYASRARLALDVFNDYQRYSSPAPLIVTCRSEHYQALIEDDTYLEDAARVEIRAVSESEARKFITSRAAVNQRWQKVLTTIEHAPDGPLALGLNTPWRLTLAVTGYEERDEAGDFLRNPDDLTASELNSEDLVRDHLLALFISAAVHDLAGRQSRVPVHVDRWLAVLAKYLKDNTTSGRKVGHRELSSTDLVPHQLWPLAGSHRARIVASALIAVPWLVGLLILLSRFQDDLAYSLLIGSSPLVFLWALQRYQKVWPPPQRLSLSQLRRPDMRRRLIVGPALTGAAAAIGLLLLWFGFGIVLGDVSWDEQVVSGVALGVTFGVLVFAGGIVMQLGLTSTNETSNPRSIIGDDLTFGLILGIGLGLVSGIGLGLLMLPIGISNEVPSRLPSEIPNEPPPPAASPSLDEIPSPIVVGISVGLMVGCPAGLSFGIVGLRYVALLLCTRGHGERWLPWRLGKFLDDCYRAGLLRIAGAGYQFRHRELQDYLARAVPPR
jgi:hypothetical protein